MFNVCKKYVPFWGEVNPEDIQVEELNGGLTNKLFKITLLKNGLNSPFSQIVVRFFGRDTDMFFERTLEEQIVAQLSHLGFGVSVFKSFSDNGGGRLEAFHLGRTLKCKDLSNPKISMKVAESLAILHSLDISIPRECRLPKNLLKWLGIARALNISRVPSAKSSVVYFFNQFEQEVRWLLSVLPRVGSPIVFSHNDLQEGNLILDEENDKLQVIDYEYSAYNFRGFDFGNHFCEHYIDYQVTEAPYFVIDRSRYPSIEHQRRFLSTYLDKAQELRAAKNQAADDTTVDHLYLEAQYFMMASSVMWAIWSLIQSVKSDIAFGYLEYAHARFTDYHLQKEKVLSELPLPDPPSSLSVYDENQASSS